MATIATNTRAQNLLQQSGKAPAQAPASEGKQQERKTITAYFRVGLVERLQLFEFLHVSYEGGLAYKYGRDARGQPLLVEHEHEIAATDPTSQQGPIVGTMANSQNAQSVDEIKSAKYQRRLRIASYENHVKPIVDKIVAYVLRNPPKRSSDPDAVKAFERIELDRHIRDLLHTGLKMTEAWIGFDAKKLPAELGERPSQAQVDVVDPEHGGQPYLVNIDPRAVVDEDGDDCVGVERVVIEERAMIKKGLGEEAKVKVRYKEWTDTEWTVWERSTEDSPNGSSAVPPVKVNGPLSVGAYKDSRLTAVDSGQHQFKVCPFYKFKPKFPIVDLCELARLLFNTGSLLNEELFNNTFTQWWATGTTPAELSAASRGIGNTIALPNDAAQIGAFGAVEGQAQNLAARCEEIRDQMYVLVSMENTGTKNSAEAAEKKKRDLETLYTLLIGIVEALEETENLLLLGMGILKAEDTDGWTRYDRKFDVESVQELMDEIKALNDLPFVPPEFKRARVWTLVRKLDPFDDHGLTEDESEELMDLTANTVDMVTALDAAGFMPAELACKQLGIPDKYAQEIIAQKQLHKDAFANGDQPQEDPANPGFDLEGNPMPPPGEMPPGGPGSLPDAAGEGGEPSDPSQPPETPTGGDNAPGKPPKGTPKAKGKPKKPAKPADKAKEPKK